MKQSCRNGNGKKEIDTSIVVGGEQTPSMLGVNLLVWSKVLEKGTGIWSLETMLMKGIYTR